MVRDEDAKAVAIGGGIALSLAAAAYFGLRYAIKIRPPEIPQYALTIEATAGGTTDPEPGTYAGKKSAVVTVTAIVFDGYEFDGWYLSGEKVSTEITYTIEVTGIVLLIASFIKIGAPVLIPAYIRPIQNAMAEQWWKTWTERGTLTDTLRIGIDYQVSGYPQFKICDAAGNGVPGQKIVIYSEPNPDATDYGSLLLNDLPRISLKPLVLVSDGNGIVTIKADYKWLDVVQDDVAQADVDFDGVITKNDLDIVSACMGKSIGEAGYLPRCDMDGNGVINVADISAVSVLYGRTVTYTDLRNTIGGAGRCHIVQVKGISEWNYGPPIKSGHYVNVPAYHESFTRLKHPIVFTRNWVHAYWLDNPSLPVWGDAYVDCFVKINGSMKF